MIVNKGVIEKINLDFNNHVNIAEYIKLADQSNNKLFKEINSKQNYYNPF
jgi:acyl-CoA thioesterase FadM